jgi:mannosylglycoprotein endo-beta-mannosidase
MWRRHTIDVTPYIQNGTFHRIFLTVEPPLHPGMVSNACPKTPPNPPHSPPTDPPCGQGGDHQMAQDAGAMQFAAGWDWVQGIPDRVTGLFDKVQLLHTQAVRVQDSYLRTLDAVVFLPESNHISESFTNNEKIDQERIDATVLISTTLINNLESTVEGHVCLEIIDEDDSNKQNSHGTRIILQRRHSITLNAKETRTQTWPNVTLPHVQLWWPHTLGKPKLYKVKAYFTIEVSNHVVISDLDEWEAGIRIVSTSIDKKTGGRLFFVNRQRIFLQGGNWIATDAMLQRGSSDRYYDEVLLHRWAGLNFIRVWGGGLTERPEFYRACDRLGILVLQEFWMTGDNNGRWAGDYDWPNDHDIFLAQAEDMIRMIRRHASLMFYCAGNELWPSSKSPPPKIQHGLRQLILDVDRDRFLILSSMDGGFKGKKKESYANESLVFSYANFASGGLKQSKEGICHFMMTAMR